MQEAPQRPMTLLYQLYLASQASRQLVRLALAGTTLNGEEYALYSYLLANGPRTQSRTARDLGMAVTTLADLLAPHIAAGRIARRRDPRDGRAWLLAISDAGRARLGAAMASFTVAHRMLLRVLETGGSDPDAIVAALRGLRDGIDQTRELLETAPDADGTRRTVVELPEAPRPI